jgi:hypothetical protein
VLAEVKAVQEHDQPALLVQRAGQQLGEPLGGGGHEPARDRRLRCPGLGLLDAGADGLQASAVPAGRQPRQHPGDDALGEQVGGGEGGIGLQGQLAGAIGGADPGAANPKAPAAERHGALLGAVPVGGAGRVVLALGAGQLGHLRGHELAHHLQADRGRGGQQPLAHALGEQSQVGVDAASQPLRQAKAAGRHQCQRALLGR